MALAGEARIRGECRRRHGGVCVCVCVGGVRTGGLDVPFSNMYQNWRSCKSKLSQGLFSLRFLVHLKALTVQIEDGEIGLF